MEDSDRGGPSRGCDRLITQYPSYGPESARFIPGLRREPDTAQLLAQISGHLSSTQALKHSPPRLTCRRSCHHHWRVPKGLDGWPWWLIVCMTCPRCCSGSLAPLLSTSFTWASAPVSHRELEGVPPSSLPGRMQMSSSISAFILLARR